MDPRDAWIIMYAGLVSIHFHPGNGVTPEEVNSILDTCALVTDGMMERVKARFGGVRQKEVPCPGLQS